MDIFRYCQIWVRLFQPQKGMVGGKKMALQILFDIPTAEKGLPPEVTTEGTLPNGAKHGTNDFRKLGDGGPCPSGGTHRYFFKLYALDTILSLGSGATKAQVEEAMQGHILAEAQLMGKYKR